MLALFCLQLAFGLLVSLLPLWPFPLNPRFFRAHFLTALGLTAGAALVLHSTAEARTLYALLAGVFLCALGSMAWLLDRAPAGKTLIVLSTLAIGVALFFQAEASAAAAGNVPHCLADAFTSAALLGSATTAMLVGHSYLIAPGLSMRPLTVALAVLGGALLLRCGVAGLDLWSWTNAAASRNLETEAILWLAVRWGVGLLAPLVLGWMAWETARIRSTQSATGILYVVVICCFLGELTGQLLLEYMKA